jgi:hypothetical protein
MVEVILIRSRHLGPAHKPTITTHVTLGAIAVRALDVVRFRVNTFGVTGLLSWFPFHVVITGFDGPFANRAHGVEPS